jgi:hypothetical protein
MAALAARKFLLFSKATSRISSGFFRNLQESIQDSILILISTTLQDFPGHRFTFTQPHHLVEAPTR